jgi:hypothetical protein
MRELTESDLITIVEICRVALEEGFGSTIGHELDLSDNELKRILQQILTKTTQNTGERI